MCFHYCNSLCILFCFLLVVVVGCDIINPATETPDPDAHLYEELVRERLTLQEKIKKGIDSYRLTRQKVEEQRVKLLEYLEDHSAEAVNEIIDLFCDAKANNKDVPADLYIAYSCWLTLLPDASHLEQITVEINRLRTSRLLEDWEAGIKDFENKRRSGMQDRIDRNGGDRLLVRLRETPDPNDTSKAVLYEDAAIKKLKIDLTN